MRRQRALVLAVWVEAAIASLLVAAQTKLGPYVVVTSRHGVHLGDVAACVAGAGAATAASRWVARTRPGRIPGRHGSRTGTCGAGPLPQGPMPLERSDRP